MRFKCGCLWRGTLLARSGARRNPLTYTSYGTGAKPIIQGSLDRSRPEDWARCGTNRWTTKPLELREGLKFWDGTSSNVEWSVSMGALFKGTSRNMLENGRRFVRFVVEERPSGARPSDLQLWCPATSNPSDAVRIRLLVRSTKPFGIGSVEMLQPGRPWRIGPSGDLHFDQGATAIGTDWTPLTANLRGDAKPDATSLHLSLGQSVPAGAQVDVMACGLWRLETNASEVLPLDIGLFLVNHGEKVGFKKWEEPRWKAENIPPWINRERSVNTMKLENDLDFWYDRENCRVIVQYPENPGRVFESIELGEKRCCVGENDCHDVVYDGLCVRYAGVHGFGGGNTENVTIRNCDICWIGGSLQHWAKTPDTGSLSHPVRLGNGIEFWGNCKNNLVERNRVWEIYDAALTNQGSEDEQVGIVWRDNVVWNAEFSYEFWNKRLSAGIVFEHNTCVNAGSGWGHRQRSDPRGAHLMHYNHNDPNHGSRSVGILIRNNIFAYSTDWLGWTGFDWRDGLVQDNNLVWLESGIPYYHWLKWDAKHWIRTREAYQGLGFDVHGVFERPHFVDPAKRDYRLKPGSPGTSLATDGGPVGVRNMPGLARDQSILPACDRQQVLSRLGKAAESSSFYWAWTNEYLDIWKSKGDRSCAMRGEDGSWRPLPYDSVRLEADVLKHTDGRRALVNYWELFSIAGTWWPDEYYAVNRATVSAQVRKLWRDHHALPVFTWHIDNPCCTNRFPSGDSYRFVASGVCSNMVRSILEGTPYPCGTDTIVARKCRKAVASPREWYFKQLDAVARFFNGLTDDVTGEPIPIVLRYAHEMEGSWFWWGRAWCSREDYRRFCRLTADYLKEKCGESRMLFAYTPDIAWSNLGTEGDNGNTFLSYYPGDKYVDIIGIDDYSIGVGDDAQVARAANETIRKLRMMSAFAKARGKIASISECGGTRKRDDFWKWVVKIATAPGVEVAFVDTWTRDWGTLPKTPAAARDLQDFARSPTALMSAPDAFPAAR